MGFSERLQCATGLDSCLTELLFSGMQVGWNGGNGCHVIREILFKEKHGF